MELLLKQTQAIDILENTTHNVLVYGGGAGGGGGGGSGAGANGFFNS